MKTNDENEIIELRCNCPGCKAKVVGTYKQLYTKETGADRDFPPIPADPMPIS